MKKIVIVTLAALVAATPALADKADASSGATPVAVRGKMLVDATGARLAPVYRVEDGGSAQIVYEGKLLTIPASTLSMVNGKLTTSLKKTDVIALR